MDTITTPDQLAKLIDLGIVDFRGYSITMDLSKEGIDLTDIDGLSFGDHVVMGRDSKFGDGVVFGAFAKIGQFSRFGKSALFGHSATIGVGCDFNGQPTFGDHSVFFPECHFGDDARFGNNVTFDSDCRFGRRSKFGRGTRFDNIGVDSPLVPLVPDLHKRIAEAIKGSLAQNDSPLEMGRWHTCETVHCRAGWAVHLAGPEGYALEKLVGPGSAGALIYLKSTGSVPDFYESATSAMYDIEACAAGEVCSG